MAAPSASLNGADLNLNAGKAIAANSASIATALTTIFILLADNFNASAKPLVEKGAPLAGLLLASIVVAGAEYTIFKMKCKEQDGFFDKIEETIKKMRANPNNSLERNTELDRQLIEVEDAHTESMRKRGTFWKIGKSDR
jgi:hypothetical protein